MEASCLGQTNRYNIEHKHLKITGISFTLDTWTVQLLLARVAYSRGYRAPLISMYRRDKYLVLQRTILDRKLEGDICPVFQGSRSPVLYSCTLRGYSIAPWAQCKHVHYQAMQHREGRIGV